MFTFLQLQRELLRSSPSLFGYLISLHLTCSSSLINSLTYMSAKCRIKRKARRLHDPCSNDVDVSYAVTLTGHRSWIEHLVLEETEGTLDNDVLED